MTYLEKYDLIHKNQHGFRRKHGCSTAVAEITNIMKNSRNFKFVVSLLVDCQNAFGSSSHVSILESLYNFCNKSTYDWFESFLSDRTFYVQKGDQRSTLRKLPERGVPQGSGSGPILFSRIFNSALIKCENDFPNVKITAYADDLGFIVVTNNENELDRIL